MLFFIKNWAQQHKLDIKKQMQGQQIILYQKLLRKNNHEIYAWISIHYHEDLWQLVLEQEAAVSNPEKQIKETYQSDQELTN